MDSVAADAGEAGASATSGDGTAWTVLVYLDAEGNLEESGVDNLLELESVGAGPGARVLVQFDRGPDYDDRDGDWEGTRRYELGAHAVPEGDGSTLATPVVEDLGEVNMGDPATLVDFLAWGVERAPADRYLVILWDHGGAWDGLAWDEVPAEDHLTLTELGQALRDARDRVGLPLWDVVYFDACVMGSLEVAHAVGDVAGIVIGSEELVPGAGGSYRALLEALREESAVTPEELAGRLVSAFAARYAGGQGTGGDGHACKGGCGVRAFGEEYAAYTDDDAVLSWYRMENEATLWDAWTSFNGAVKGAAGDEWAALVRAARAADRFHYDEEREAMDVGDFAARVSAATGVPGVKAAADALAAAVGDFVGGYTTSPNHPSATGVMVKFPVPGRKAAPSGGAASGKDVYVADPAFAGAADAFTSLAAAADEGDDVAPTFGDVRVEWLDGFVAIDVVVEDENPYAVDIAVTDEESEHGEVLAWIHPTSVEETEEGLLASYEWDGTVLGLRPGDAEEGEGQEAAGSDASRARPPRPSRGSGSADEGEPPVVIAPAFRESLESREYLLEGVYRVGVGGEEHDAFLRFGLDGRFLSAWLTGDLASEIKPRAGDAFAPAYLGWDADGEPVDLVDRWVPAGSEGGRPWSLEVLDLEGGHTGFSAYAEDLAGNSALSDPIVLDVPDPADGDDDAMDGDDDDDAIDEDDDDAMDEDGSDDDAMDEDGSDDDAIDGSDDGDDAPGQEAGNLDGGAGGTPVGDAMTEGEGDASTPGPGALVAVGALGVVAALRRRRSA